MQDGLLLIELYNEYLPVMAGVPYVLDGITPELNGPQFEPENV